MANKEPQEGEEVVLQEVLPGELKARIQAQEMEIRLPLLLQELQTKYFKKEVEEVATIEAIDRYLIHF